jgi:hypothetical protein
VTLESFLAHRATRVAESQTATTGFGRFIWRHRGKPGALPTTSPPLNLWCLWPNWPVSLAPRRNMFWGQRRRHLHRQERAPAHSGNPAFRSPSSASFAFDCPPRAIHSDIVKAGSSSSTRAAASWASALRPRWANADARQR